MEDIFQCVGGTVSRCKAPFLPGIISYREGFDENLNVTVKTI